MPRVKFYATSNFDAWAGRSETSRRVNTEYDSDGQQESHGVHKTGTHHPVVANGTIMPTSVLQAMMQAVPGDPSLLSSEELVPLAEAIQRAFDTLLTERERYVMDALWFEGLSRRELALRLPWGKSQLDRLEKAARVKLFGDSKLREAYVVFQERTGR